MGDTGTPPMQTANCMFGHKQIKVETASILILSYLLQLTKIASICPTSVSHLLDCYPKTEYSLLLRSIVRIGSLKSQAS